MKSDGSEKRDVKLPDPPLGNEIEAASEEGKTLMVSVLSAMGEEAAVSYKEASNKDD